MYVPCFGSLFDRLKNKKCSQINSEFCWLPVRPFKNLLASSETILVRFLFFKECNVTLQLLGCDIIYHYNSSEGGFYDLDGSEFFQIEVRLKSGIIN